MILTSITLIDERKSEDFIALRKGLGYCWSVAVAAYPAIGLRLMETFFASADPDNRWIMNENLKKKRLERMDAQWVTNGRLKMEVE